MAAPTNFFSNSYYISATIIDKVSSGNYKQIQIKCASSDTVEKLKDTLYSQLALNQTESRIHIAFKGKILKNDNNSLESYNLIPAQYSSTPKIFVTFKKINKQISSKLTKQTQNELNNQQNKPSIPTPPPPSPPPPPIIPDHPPNTNINNNNNNPNFDINNDIIDAQFANLSNNDDEHKQCRLCYSNEENNPLLGQLFQPCLCSGTMKWIHLKCLNQWRAMAPNEVSYYRCDQCQFEYNLKRAYWADIVAHPRTSQIISIFCLFIGIIIFGLITFKLPLADWVYAKIEWFPLQYFSHKMCPNQDIILSQFSIDCEYNCNSWFPWKECPRQCYPCYIMEMDGSEWYLKLMIEVIFSGILIMAIIGLYAQRQLLWRHKMIFLLTLAQSTRVWRLFILLGIGHSFYGLLKRVKIIVKNFLFRFGEKILNMNQNQNQNQDQINQNS